MKKSDERDAVKEWRIYWNQQVCEAKAKRKLMGLCTGTLHCTADLINRSQYCEKHRNKTRARNVKWFALWGEETKRKKNRGSR